MFILFISLFIVVCLAQQEVECENPTFSKCNFRSGQVFDGVFGISARAPLQTGLAAYVTIAGSHAIIQTSKSAVFSRFIITDDFVTISDLSASESGAACPKGQLGKYEYRWKADCSEVRLQAKFDECALRRSIIRNGTDAMTLRVRPCTKGKSCGELQAGDIHRIQGVDEASLHVGAQGMFIEFGRDNAVHFGQLSIADGRALVRSFGQQYGESKESCDVADQGVYNIGSEIDRSGLCRAIDLSLDADACEERAERIEGVRLAPVDVCEYWATKDAEIAAANAAAAQAAAARNAPPATEKPKSYHPKFSVGHQKLFNHDGVWLPHASHYDSAAHEERKQIRHHGHVHQHRNGRVSEDESSIEDEFMC